MRFQISLRTRERAIIAQVSSLQSRLQVTIKRNNRTNNAQTSHFGWAKAIFRSPERKSESMTNAAPHFPSPFSASGSECKKESRHHPSSSMRRSYVRKDILHPAGVKRSENGLLLSLPLSIWNASRTTMKSLHVIKSAVPSPGTQRRRSYSTRPSLGESSGSSTRSDNRSHE